LILWEIQLSQLNFETFSVFITKAMKGDGCAMRSGAVSFILVPSILRVLFVQLNHIGITSGFCKDTGSGYMGI
jgi:hypothetical protein